MRSRGLLSIAEIEIVCIDGDPQKSRSRQCPTTSPIFAVPKLGEAHPMRLVRYSVAASLDGYIAGPKGEFDWILQDPTGDFEGIFARVDTDAHLS